MAVDNTSLFRARAKAIQAKEWARAKKESSTKSVDVKPPGDWKTTSPVGKSAAGSSPNFANYSFKAAEIRHDLTELRDAVVSRRKDYIAAVGHYSGFTNTPGMSDWERSKMDSETEQAIQQCARLIRALKRQIQLDSSLRAADEGPHLDEVARLLDCYLKKIAKIITDLRSVRLKKTADMKRISRLSTLVQMYEDKVKVSPTPSPNETSYKDDKKLMDMSTNSSQSNLGSSEQENFTTGLRRRGPRAKGDLKSSDEFSEPSAEVRNGSDGDHLESVGDDALEGISEEERIQLCAENEQLFAKLSHANSDIENVEKQLSEIYRLQETFAEKVLEQEKDIELVNEAAVTTVENIREGNEQIREAIQNIASRRVIILFCIIVLTFTLLFLDWYNP